MGSTFYYKYLDHHALDVLADLRLKVTPPNEFNDPFEFLPHIVATMSVAKAKRKLKQKDTQRQLYGNWCAEGYRGSFKQFKEDLMTGRDHFAKLMTERFSSNLARYRSGFQNRVSDDHGVLCLSRNPGSILMWSHYSDSHKGTVIGLKSDHPFFAKSAIYEVDYLDARVLFDPTWHPRSPEFQAYSNSIIRRKASHWEYEEEMRMLVRLRSCKKIEREGRYLYFLEIPLDLIAKVIFGMRCPGAQRQKLKNVAAEKGLKILFEEARHHDSQFGLTFHEA